jgi:hypothetical protein
MKLDKAIKEIHKMTESQDKILCYDKCAKCTILNEFIAICKELNRNPYSAFDKYLQQKLKETIKKAQTKG